MSRTERRQQEEAAVKAAREEKRAERRHERAARLTHATESAADAEADAAVDKIKENSTGGAQGDGEKPGFLQALVARIKSWKTWQKVLACVLIVVILAASIVGVAAYRYMSGLVDKMQVDPPPQAPEDEEPVDPEELYDLSLVDVDGYINILLLGVDSRDMSNIQGTRSDAIMIISINKETNDVQVISVYRDTLLKMGDTSTLDKITHACVYGGPEMTVKSLNQAMDLNISNYVVVNFKAVADLVDAVGGVTINVEAYEIQQLNKYTAQTAQNIGHDTYQLVQSPGRQTLEGVQAVAYGRIRKGVGDDFKRTERMRMVLSLVFSKMKNLSFSEIKDIIDMMTDQVKTNLQMSDILGLAARLPRFNITGSVGFPYNVQGGYLGKVSYVFPQNLAANTTKLHQEVFGQADYTPSATVNTLSNLIAARIEQERQAQIAASQKEKDPEEPDDPDEEEPDVSDEPGDAEDPGDESDDDPGEPGESTDPSESTDPTEPTDPGQTTDPTDPGQGTDPTQPADPGTDPNASGTDPSAPGTDPNTPATDPNLPATDPNAPAADPNAPGQAADPNAVTDPTVPADPGATTDPAQQSAPAPDAGQTGTISAAGPLLYGARVPALDPAAHRVIQPGT